MAQGKQGKQNKPTALGRLAVRQRGLVKPRGCNKFHNSPEERLRRFEMKAKGHEFIPALMHTLGRVLSGKACETATEERLLAAMKELRDDASFLVTSLKAYEKLDLDLRARAFSARYMTLSPDRPIDDTEFSSILVRANQLQGSTRGVLSSKGGDCCCCCDGGSTDPQPPVERDNYALRYSHLYCVDESNPEFAGSDEPYVVFATITEAMALAGTPALSGRSPVYADVDDGDRRPSNGEENIILYGPVAPRPIDTPFLTAATCFEHDAGDADEMMKGLRSSLTTIATTAAGIGGPAGWIVAGAAGVGVAITFLVDLWADDDQIDDVQTVAFTEAQANAETSTVNPVVLPPLHFDGGSDDGIYDVYLKLERS
jgi:hypothetical protein